jgi:hypothetical protein
VAQRFTAVIIGLFSEPALELRKNSDLDSVLKGRGFSRAESPSKSMAALAAGAPPSWEDDSFRGLLE